ncbi:uncharacterized protein LOC107844256 [Capsicum annuum]|uniref:uncharacterized protein LOC107844256 n=1 Tax=Capsicum annuum TaxID=4072 RepID=UPI0007BF3E3C|nr:uncharacterized protein LOC107844256 [Capsicum annuum]
MASSIRENKEDPMAFRIQCTIGTHMFEKSLCDLGESINLIPYAIYRRLGLGNPTPTMMRLLMANRSIKRPVGVLLDVLVKVDRFILLVDFEVIDCEIDQEVSIILDQPFLYTGRAIIDLYFGEMKFWVHDGEVSFRVCKMKKQPIDLQMVLVIDIADEDVNDRSLEDPT